MANDRMYLRCVCCSGVFNLGKYYPIEWYIPINPSMGTALNDFLIAHSDPFHQRNHGKHGRSLESHECFDLIFEGTPVEGFWIVGHPAYDVPRIEDCDCPVCKTPPVAPLDAARKEKTDGDDFLRWCRYFLETEDYDRSICTYRSPRTGDALPSNNHERMACGKFARAKLHELKLEANSPGKREALELSHEGLRRVLDAVRKEGE